MSSWLWPFRATQDGDTKTGVQVASENAVHEPNEKADPNLGTSISIEPPVDDEDQASDIERTPKAKPTNTYNSVPSFNLDDSRTFSTESANDQETAPVTSTKHQTSAMKPPPTKPSPPIGLMPPPSVKAPSLKPLPTTTTLSVPSKGPLPNRGPPQSQAAKARTSLAPTANTAGKRNKVLLSPGHSPLDWATLSRSKKNLAGVPTLQRVTPAMLKHNNGRKGKPAWSSYAGKVYNVTPYLPFHPGGEGELMRCAGRDGAKLFMEVHPWVNWENMLNSCVVGILVSEAEGEGLDGMD